MQWYLSTAKIDEIVEANDQWEAYDTLRARPVIDFALLVEAQPVNETAEAGVCIRTSALFARWGRLDDARTAIANAVAVGMPDTSAEDLAPAERPTGGRSE